MAEIDFTKLGLNTSKIVIGLDTNDYFKETDFPFSVGPKDYLDYARLDLKENSQRGRINSATNAKRAIDCEIDWVIHYLHLNIEIESTKKICERFAADEIGLNFKLRVIRAFMLAPVFTIAKIRNLRNKIEHEYSVPTKEQVVEAIELAEMFISTVDSKLDNLYMFEITDEKHHQGVEDGCYSGLRFKIKNNSIALQLDNLESYILPEDPCYPSAIAMMLLAFQEDIVIGEYFKYFLELKGVELGKRRVQISRFMFE